MKTFQGSNVVDMYPQLVRSVIQEGRKKSPRGKLTLDLHPVMTEYTDLQKNRYIYIPGRDMNYAFALAEVIWILGGRGDYEFIGFYNTAMKKYLDYEESKEIDVLGMTTESNFYASYGRRLRHHSEVTPFNVFEKTTGIDQLSEVVTKLKADMDTRQAVACLWDVNLDNLPGMNDYPCNVMLMFKVTDGKLDVTVIRRSNDVIWGYPYNIVQFSHIQEYVAKKLGVEVGHFIEYIDSLHIYLEEYKPIYDFMVKKVESNNLCYNMGVDTSDNTTADQFERFLAYFYEIEAEWRRNIPTMSDTDLGFMVHRHVNDLYSIFGYDPHRTNYDKHIDNQRSYWINVFGLLFAFHLYKAKRNTDAIRALQIFNCNIMFGVMAAESMKGIRNTIMSDVVLSTFVGKDMRGELGGMYGLEVK